MTLYALLRIVKFVAIVGLGAGSVGAFVPRALDDRRHAAYFVAGPSFGVTWIAGFLLAFHTGASFLSTWILGSLVLSLFSLQVVLFAVGREGRRTKVTAALAILPLVATIVLMVTRPT